MVAVKAARRMSVTARRSSEPTNDDDSASQPHDGEKEAATAAEDARRRECDLLRECSVHDMLFNCCSVFALKKFFCYSIAQCA